MHTVARYSIPWYMVYLTSSSLYDNVNLVQQFVITVTLSSLCVHDEDGCSVTGFLPSPLDLFDGINFWVIAEKHTLNRYSGIDSAGLICDKVSKARPHVRRLPNWGAHTESDKQEERGEEMRPVKQATWHVVVTAGRSIVAVVILCLADFVFPIVYHGPLLFFLLSFPIQHPFSWENHWLDKQEVGELEQLALHWDGFSSLQVEGDANICLRLLRHEAVLLPMLLEQIQTSIQSSFINAWPTISDTMSLTCSKRLEKKEINIPTLDIEHGIHVDMLFFEAFWACSESVFGTIDQQRRHTT